MSKWAGKYVIGLTGNIGTGKSVVRRMLEHMGALGIDADSFSHRAMAKGAPGYQPIVEMFGRWILGPDGEIDRSRLGRIVFSDPRALAHLEAIIHPIVLQAIDWMIQRSEKSFVVIEAIKLIEAGIHKDCDSIWTVYAPPEIQMSRLMQKRGMSEAEARQRIMAQAPQEKKVAAANVVIRNIGSFEDTWRQVSAAWQKTVPAGIQAAPAAPQKKLAPGEVVVTRGKPRDSARIAALISRVANNGRTTASDIMAAFGDKAFLLMRVSDSDQLIGVAGWQVENLVSRTTDIVIDPAFSPAQALPGLIQEMERSSKDLQCEASLIFTSPELSIDSLWKSLGYERRTPQTLGVAVWQEAAIETLKPGQALYFKQLRVDRVLRPI
ncbi:MAG: dephospho-CoA kinase [Chloroflexi bacterium]|nr:dephospho-CoA kinase [Chloroflexota bacterium]